MILLITVLVPAHLRDVYFFLSYRIGQTMASVTLNSLCCGEIKEETCQLSGVENVFLVLKLEFKIKTHDTFYP